MHVNTRLTDRRRILQMVGLAVAGATVPPSRASTGEDGGGFALYQDDRCIPIEPLYGDEPVEDFYDYAYPQDEFFGSFGSDGTTYSSEGTVELQRDDTSLLFLYEGPDGLSLVVVHGHLHGEDDDGGAVTFAIDGLPESGEWIVMDDYLVDEDGDEVSEDWWTVDDGTHVVDWTYEPGRTDGGVFWPLEEDLELVLEPAFNEDAYFADECDCGPIERWEVLSGDIDDPDRHPLAMDLEVTIRKGPCEAALEDGVSEKKRKKEEKRKKPKRKERKKEEKPKRKKKEREKPRKEKKKRKRPEKEKRPKGEKAKKEKPKRKKPERESRKKRKQKKEKPKKPEKPKKERKKPKREKKQREKPKKAKKERKPAHEKPKKEEKKREKPKRKERPKNGEQKRKPKKEEGKPKGEKEEGKPKKDGRKRKPKNGEKPREETER